MPWYVDGKKDCSCDEHPKRHSHFTDGTHGAPVVADMTDVNRRLDEIRGFVRGVKADRTPAGREEEARLSALATEMGKANLAAAREFYGVEA